MISAPDARGAAVTATPNLLIDIVHYRSGEVLETQCVWDAGLCWLLTRHGWQVRSDSGCGRPTPEWLAANPMPVGRAA